MTTGEAGVRGVRGIAGSAASSGAAWGGVPQRRREMRAEQHTLREGERGERGVAGSDCPAVGLKMSLHLHAKGQPGTHWTVRMRAMRSHVAAEANDMAGRSRRFIWMCCRARHTRTGP